ncbi:MAG: LysR family transcriptional regulator [Caldilineaceae bacterium SB0675_bin_29]|uniref:LysR family transcriptional regulator n=1 Tax=Caldilineaceae bacterium SB0675_bin_29 TaxID=2605266 RepID=A0A6B1G372_9CHLR|nr:LysR family transcriptional regulator [Caldilineaceae bacterium SB0675_bin_29]
MRLKGLDLNLLVALDVLLDERNVSRAAERLYVSQPAASAALGRLRDYFKDELLVLHGKRMIPTSYAENLQPEVRQILAQVDNMVSMTAEFDPLRSERVFRFMASDYITTVLLIPMASELERLAPGVWLDTRLPDEAIQLEFERGEIDVMLVPEEFTVAKHPSELVFEESHVIVGWAENPIFQREVSKEAFFNASHVGVRIGPDRDMTFTERNVEALGQPRKMAVFAPNFSVVPWFLVGTHRLAVMQQRLVATYKSVMALATAPLPFEFPSMRLMAQYHSARTADQGLLWLLDRIRHHAAMITDGRNSPG